MDNYEAANITSGNASYMKDWQDSTTTGWTVGAGTWSVASDGGSNRYYLSGNPGGSNNMLGAYSTINSTPSVGDFVFTCRCEGHRQQHRQLRRGVRLHELQQLLLHELQHRQQRHGLVQSGRAARPRRSPLTAGRCSATPTTTP